jgi:hypothetical protein
MPSSLENELHEFHRFLGQKLESGRADLSPEEALDEWRRGHPDAHANDEIAAIQEALDDMVRGDKGIPFDDFDRDFRKRHNIPSQS